MQAAPPRDWSCLPMSPLDPSMYSWAPSLVAKSFLAEDEEMAMVR